MAIVNVPFLGRTLIMPAEIESFLADIGVEYRRWSGMHAAAAKASAEEILVAYQPELEFEKNKNDFAGYELFELTPRTTGLDETLTQLRREHWHTDIETRFILAGRGICYLHPESKPVVPVEVEPGDLISIEKGVRHWWNLCAELPFRGIQFISRPERDSTIYTRSDIELEYEAAYVSPAYLACAGGCLR